MSKAGLIIIFVGLVLRLYKVDLPLLEFYPSRQIQTAEIARNFYKYELPITRPVVSYIGPSLTPFLVEFPGYNFAIAFIYRMIGSSDEMVGRIFSIVGWLISCYFLFQIAKKYVGDLGAKVALFFYTFSPLSILVSRSFQPDQWMVTFSLTAIYFLVRSEKTWYFWLSAIFVSLSILLKLPSAVFTLIPIYFLMMNVRQKSGVFRIMSYSVIAIAPSITWYFYVVLINRSQGLLGTATQISNWFGPEVFLNPKYWSNLFGFEMNLVLLPVGMVLFLIGVITKLKNGRQFLYFWLGSVVLYFLIFNKHNMTHEYYHLPFLPIAAIFFGIGANRVIEKIDGLALPKNLLILVFSTLIFMMMLPPTLARAYKPIERFSRVIATGEEIQKLTKPTDLIIGSMDAGPSLLYYADRRGWPFEVDRGNTAETLAFYGVRNTPVKNAISDLEEKRDKGAVIFASAYKNQFLLNGKFAKYMYENYQILTESENYLIFDLTSQLPEK